MNHQVEHHAAGFGLVQQPVIGPGPGLEAAPGQADDSDIADSTGLDLGVGGGIFREEAQHMSHQQLHPGLVAGVDHRLALGGGAGQRFLADHVLACCRCLQGNVMVCVGGRANVDDIHLIQQLIECGTGGCLIVGGQPLCRFCCGRVDRCDPGRSRRPALGVCLAHEACADNSYAHLPPPHVCIIIRVDQPPID